MSCCSVLWRTQVKPCTSLHIGPLLSSCPAASILAPEPLNPRCENLPHLKAVTHLHRTAVAGQGLLLLVYMKWKLD